MSELDALLRSLQPRLHPRSVVYASAGAAFDWRSLEPIGLFREDEGWTLIVDEAVAQAAGLPVHMRAAWITLTVNSDLHAVGLTAAVAGALADAGIACNVVAAVQHDHLFVPAERGPRALELLQALQQSGRSPDHAGRAPG